MAKLLGARAVQTVVSAVPLLLRFPVKRFWVDYDRAADVLYISFRRPQKSTEIRATDEGLLLRYNGKELVGITVLEASTHKPGLPGPQAEPAVAGGPRRRPARKKT